MSSGFLVAALVLSLACAKKADAPASPAARDAGANHVTAEAVSDVGQLTPGVRFLVGARFRIAPGWHISWKNPGDSGIPTRVSVEAPPGFTVGTALYPGPSRFTSPGDIVSYGYHDDAMVLVPVVAPADVSGPVTLTVTARWLVCRDACIPGRATLPLTFPRRDDAADIAPFLARVPSPLPATVRPTWDGMTLALPLLAGGEFFPDPPEGVSAPSVTSGGALRVPFERSGEGPLAGPQGVVRIGDRFHTVEVPWPAAAVPPGED